MIKVKKLRFKNIGRFIDLQEISFENLSNLVQVDAINHNTGGGSSGSGKSTIFNALDFLFGLNSIPNSQLQSRLIDESIFVEGEFDLDGQPLIISRGKKLKININGETTTGSSKLAEEKLDEILSIPRHLFKAMMHKCQGEKGFFLNFTPSEMNSFLTDCLGLSKFKNHIVNLDVKIADLSKTIGSLSVTSESTKAALKASQEAMVALGLAPIKDIDQDAISELKIKVESIKAGLEGLLLTHKRDEEEFVLLNKPTLEHIPFDSSILEKCEKEILSIQGKLSEMALARKDAENTELQSVSALKLKKAELTNKIQKGRDAKEEAVKLAQEILKVRKNTCPRCEQSWLTDTVKTEEAKLLDKINNLRNIIAIGEQSDKELFAVQEELAILLSKPELELTSEEIEMANQSAKLTAVFLKEKLKKSIHDTDQSNKNKIKQDNFDKNYKILRDTLSIQADQIRGRLDIYRRSLDTASVKLKSYEETKLRYEISLGKLEAQKTTYEEKYREISKELEDLTQQLTVVEELKRAIKSYLSCSFDEALAVISENATKMLRNVPNMATATLQLDGTKETKEGKIKEEVVALIHMDGEENIPIKTLSGGERASVDLAVDISVLNLIEERTNIGCNIMALDEPFGGLDTTNIEMVLEVLKNANTNKKLIIVDHNEIVKSQISDRVTVVRDGLTSKIT
jgi:DNA repair exonuclease SbcCD ATPase subunit